MGGATLHTGYRRAPFAAVAFAVGLLQTSCIVLPARIASGVKGVVVDAASGELIADALVVVRFDGRFGDVLPDREVLGHREARSDARGRFRVRSLVRPGLSAWPLYKTDARVVSVFKAGYRCAKPIAVRRDGEVKIPLERALDAGDQRESCRPVPANRGEAEDYMTAWRGLFPAERRARNDENERQLARLLEARAALGFGENCRGPVSDLALARDGLRAGYSVVPEGPEIHLVEFAPDRPRSQQQIGRDEGSPARRLAWTSAGHLVLWEPAADTYRFASPSIFGSNRFEIVWKAPRSRGAPPAALGSGATRVENEGRPLHSLLEPADLNDEGDSRWFGRTFSLERSLDPATGLARDRLAVVRENGTRYKIPLPGEACGPHGRFGRPHYRITASGDAGIDLRFVDGGCHAVQIDLETGAWEKIDESSDTAVCSDTRSVPASHFTTALRGYVREVQVARTAAGGDSVASYALIIGPDGSTHVETRNYLGEPVSAAVPDFPLATPLRRIDVSLVGSVSETWPAPPPVPARVEQDPL
jgi:hypothetical protein